MSRVRVARRLLRCGVRSLALLFAGLAVVLTASCATAVESPEAPAADWREGDRSQEAALPRPSRASAARDARARTPPPRAPFATHEACQARAELVRAMPLTFEGKLVRTLYEVEVAVQGPPGLVATLGVYGESAPSFADVALTPLVALKVPAGPAQDAPRGPSGALFELGGLAVAGLVNLALFPVTVPLGILAGRPDAFLMDAPRFSEGMFDDAVLDQATWEAEVARRAAPHTEALAREAERQQRFSLWLGSLLLEQQQRSCTLDDTGACALRVWWPARSLTVGFSGLACAEPPPSADDKEPASAAPASAAPANQGPPPRHFSTLLPELPPPVAPVPLVGPPRPDSDRRGEGAEATLERWRAGGAAALEDAAARGRFKEARAARAKKGESLRDVTLVCRLRTRGGDFDADGSAPELRLRLAWGFDDQVAGQSFGTLSARERHFGVEGVTLLPGELVKLSAMDVDAFVDDWLGMDVVVFDGTLPLRFEHPRFGAECGALGSLRH